jgi:hypothetical protein
LKSGAFSGQNDQTPTTLNGHLNNQRKRANFFRSLLKKCPMSSPNFDSLLAKTAAQIENLKQMIEAKKSRTWLQPQFSVFQIQQM